jgi:hypothetical protein
MTQTQGLLRGISAHWNIVGAGLLLSAGLIGCGGTTVQNNNDSIPGSTQVHTYVGTQVSSGTFGGVYGLTTDHSTNYFNFTDVNPFALGDFNYVGNFSAANQFQNLNVTETAAPTLGETPLMLEVPGDTAVVELYYLGYLPPVVFAESNSCQPLTSPTTFQFIDLGAFDYGSVTVNSTGSTWSFSNYDLLQMDGANENAAALPNGVCGTTTEGFATTIPETLDGQPIIYTVAVSPNGYFIMDRDKTHLTTQNSDVLSPLVGVAQPSSPLSTSSLMAANYAGFEFDNGRVGPQAPVNQSEAITQPLSFSGANATILQMVGGIFPSGDPTQTPGTDISVSLGTQDTSQNGFYPAVTVTLPDNHHDCVGTTHAGTSASGIPTCVLPGFAVAGNPGGKFVLFITIADSIAAQGSAPGGTANIQFLLYQQ